MNDTHLNLRLNSDLERAIARRARERGIAKSELVREVIGRHLAPAGPQGIATTLTARALRARWKDLPHLTPAEAVAMAADIAAARAHQPLPSTPWE
jgi:hypothetical protein